MNPSRIIAIVASVCSLFLVTCISTSAFESVDAHEILVVQDLGDGELHWYTSPGIKWQGFGRVTKLPKVVSRDFDAPIRFNDNGHGKVTGSVQFRLPLDTVNLRNIYTTFGSPEDLGVRLLQKVIDKSILATGGLLSSTESASEKRNNLTFWIEDQIQNGVYRTVRRDVKTKDVITGEERTATVAEISITGGVTDRQEPSQLAAFGIQPFNFAVTDVPYATDVEAQIQKQRENYMAVQTAIAESRKAEQQALTAEQQGRANAAKAKWEQETIKARKVTEAQQNLEVASLDAKAADQEKRANILRGEGEAERRRLVMNADNALEKKADVWLEAQKVWATAVAQYGGAWVPSVVMGGSGTATAGSGMSAMMDMIAAKTARDLSLDMNVGRTRTTATAQKP